jgi:hypothetical protein
MSRPVDEILSRFSPDTSGLDRDALVFAAGRASARPNRRYAALAACLAVSQAITLGALGYQLAGHKPGVVPREATVPTAPAQPPIPAESSPADESRAVGLRAGAVSIDLSRTQGSADLVPDGPPLYAWSAVTADADLAFPLPGFSKELNHRGTERK